MEILAQTIRRYEHRRWAAEPSRPVLPFGWGLEHIGGRADDPDPRAFLDRFAAETLARSEEWFACGPAEDYRLAGDVLTFTSAIRSPWPENNTVYARLFRARNSGPAVVVLPQWNADWNGHADVCRYLKALGITALRLSMPYHDRRAIPGHPRADFLVGPNLGLTMQANRQAVCDARQCLRWLERQGYGKLGLLGTSIGSALSFICMAHDPAVRAGAFLHVSTYFGDVVANGLTTMQVWDSLRTKVTAEELRRWWAPISPFPYVPRLRRMNQQRLLISGKYDATFWYEFSEGLFREMKRNAVEFESLVLPCGHYSLDQTPFRWAAGLRFGTFLFGALS